LDRVRYPFAMADQSEYFSNPQLLDRSFIYLFIYFSLVVRAKS